MENSRFYALYVIPDPNPGENARHTILRSPLAAECEIRMSGEGFIIEGERKHSWSLINYLLGGAPFKNQEDFFKSLSEVVKDKADRFYLRSALADFSNKNNLEMRRLVPEASYDNLH